MGIVEFVELFGAPNVAWLLSNGVCGKGSPEIVVLRHKTIIEDKHKW